MFAFECITILVCAGVCLRFSTECMYARMCEIVCVSKRGSFSLSVCTFYRLYLFIYLFFPEEKNVCENVHLYVCVPVSEWLLMYSKQLILSLDSKLR